MIRRQQYGWMALGLMAMAACGVGMAADQAEVASGTTLSLALDQTLTSQRHAAGSTFSASVRRDVRDAEGAVLIPAGSTVHGEILVIQEDPPRLQLEFSSIDVRGESRDISTSLVDFAPTKHSEMTDEGKKIGGGAAVGAVVGGIVGGDVGGAAVGAVTGAAAGTGVALLTKDSHVFIPAGSVLAVELVEPLQVTLATEDEAASTD